MREQVGLSTSAMQLRPLHMVMVRGPLPEFNGHCVDGSKTRVTITSDRDIHKQTVWQIGGQVSEIGVDLEADELISHISKRACRSPFPLSIKVASNGERIEWIVPNKKQVAVKDPNRSASSPKETR